MVNFNTQIKIIKMEKDKSEPMNISTWNESTTIIFRFLDAYVPFDPNVGWKKTSSSTLFVSNR